MTASPSIIRAPAKLILSGEHAVVYGAPALAMAIDRWLEVRVQPRHDQSIVFLSETQNNAAMALAQHTLDMFIQHYNLKKSTGADFYITSQLWIGSGMGSSAALILALLTACAAHWRITLVDDDLRALATEIEHYQHGRSSGLDVHVCSQGGMGLYSPSSGAFNVQERIPSSLPFLLIHTGTPESTTAECVQYVATTLTTHSHLLNEFRNVTLAMDIALQHNNLSEWSTTIRENHQLLSTIGVVPSDIQSFIKRIEHCGGAAKICGAGSMRGSSAGVLLATHEDMSALTHLISSHPHFSFIQTKCSQRGVHVV